MDVDEFSFQNKRTPLDDNSLQEQLENTIHAAMLRPKLSSSMGKPFKSHNPPSSHPKRSLSQSSFISDLTPTDDASIFDSTVYINPDLIKYDSQELVADYDDRSEVMRELEQKTTISPSQDVLQQYDEINRKADYDHRSQISDKLYHTTLAHYSQDIVLKPIATPDMIEIESPMEIANPTFRENEQYIIQDDIMNSQGSQPQKIKKGKKSKNNRHARQRHNKRNNSNPPI